jgi:hypothetical protein
MVTAKIFFDKLAIGFQKQGSSRRADGMEVVLGLRRGLDSAVVAGLASGRFRFRYGCYHACHSLGGWVPNMPAGRLSISRYLTGCCLLHI